MADAPAADAGDVPGPVCDCAECDQARRVQAHFEARLAQPDAGPVADAVEVLRSLAHGYDDGGLGGGTEMRAIADALAAHDAARRERDAQAVAQMRSAAHLLRARQARIFSAPGHQK